MHILTPPVTYYITIATCDCQHNNFQTQADLCLVFEWLLWVRCNQELRSLNAQEFHKHCHYKFKQLYGISTYWSSSHYCLRPQNTVFVTWIYLNMIALQKNPENTTDKSRTVLAIFIRIICSVNFFNRTNLQWDRQRLSCLVICLSLVTDRQQRHFWSRLTVTSQLYYYISTTGRTMLLR